MCIRDSSWRAVHGNPQDSHPHPCFTEDNRYVIFVSDKEGKPCIYRVDLEPVSYTHLDVYKRQQQWGLSEQYSGLIRIFPGDEAAGKYPAYGSGGACGAESDKAAAAAG